ncbi:LLM class F420-dependent oxidoreductase [Nocardioides sp. J54]|uniref:LLM class F420-dependent oxidoreductase n=1 Tax=Nocardioides sp. J54 TaxID=935866 RepID=UPI0004B885F6|nr:LLM class F420-dependent oxidoreductase [Nocardioides sp. J54]
MTTAERSLGVTLPFDGLPLAAHRPLLRTLVEAGYDEVWTGEVNGLDGFGPLALFRGWEDSITVSCAAASVFTRGPGVLAMTAATLAEAAPGRCRFGLGAGSPVLAETWNGVPFERPYRRTVETFRFVRAALAGERVGDGFRLARPVDVPPRLLLGVAGPRMQDFAAAEADTMALNFLSPADVARIRERCARVDRVVPGALETAVRVFLLPRDDPGAEQAARRFLAGYLTVPTYAAFQRWLGREELLAPMQEAWQAGDRRGAMAAIPERVLHDLVVFGKPDDCAASIGHYLEAGADVVTLALVPDPDAAAPEARVEFLAALAQASGVARS